MRAVGLQFDGKYGVIQMRSLVTPFVAFGAFGKETTERRCCFSCQANYEGLSPARWEPLFKIVYEQKQAAKGAFLLHSHANLKKLFRIVYKQVQRGIL